MTELDEIKELELVKPSAEETLRINGEMLNKFAKEIALIGFETEKKREESLIQNAGYMQAAFSFVIVALFTLLPVVIKANADYSFRVPAEIILAAFSSVGLFLFISLLLATLVHWRRKNELMKNVEDYLVFIDEHFEELLPQAAQDNHITDIYSKMQKSMFKTNTTRVKLAQLSMVSFFVSLALILIFFMVMISYLIKGG